MLSLLGLLFLLIIVVKMDLNKLKACIIVAVKLTGELNMLLIAF